MAVPDNSIALRSEKSNENCVRACVCVFLCYEDEGMVMIRLNGFVRVDTSHRIYNTCIYVLLTLTV